MSRRTLHEHAHGVVHRSKHRTRLRVPRRYRKSTNLHEVKSELEKIPGIQSVEVNEETGSVLIHHDETPQLLDKVSQALDEAAPELLACMLMPGAEELEVGIGVVSKLFQSLFASPEHAVPGNGGTAVAHAVGVGPGASSVAKNYLPMAFVAAGVWQMLQEEALLAGIAPLALFYYGFDMYWKIRQEQRTAYLEQKAPSGQHMPNAAK